MICISIPLRIKFAFYYLWLFLISQREVLEMRYYQDLSFKEIADITGVSINTALGRMRYAILNMRRMAEENSIELSMA